MYLLNAKEQSAQIREMEMVRKDTDKAEAFYHEPSTGTMWKSFFPKAGREGLGPKILRTEPVPEPLEEWLDTCLAGSQLANAGGLGLELCAKPEKWESIIDIIENNYRDYERKQIKVFFSNLGLKDYKTLLDELNIQEKDLGLDEDILDKLARRAKIIQFKRFWTL